MTLLQTIGQSVRDRVAADRLSPADDAVRIEVLRHFAETGEAPATADLAVASGLPEATVAEALARLGEGGALVLREGRVASMYPFSATETRHRVRWDDGREAWALCATDAYGLHPMLGESVTVTSRCPQCEAEIRSRIEGGRVAAVEPAGALEYVARARGDGCIAKSACPHMNLYCSPEHLGLWRAAHPELDSGETYRPDEVLEHGRWIFGDFLAPRHPVVRPEHWDGAYRRRGAQSVSWYAPALSRSLQFIERTGIGPADPVIDIGGGASPLVDDLLRQGFARITVLDVSAEALAIARERIGTPAGTVDWRVADITRVDLPHAAYRLWHDRAVFHFLVNPRDREAYLERLRHALAPGGWVVMACFGPTGPRRCSDLPVQRYSAEGLAEVFCDGFRLAHAEEERHTTPAGKVQTFTYALLQRAY